MADGGRVLKKTKDKSHKIEVVFIPTLPSAISLLNEKISRFYLPK
jgi:hypothetical protein